MKTFEKAAEKSLTLVISSVIFQNVIPGIAS